MGDYVVKNIAKILVIICMIIILASCAKDDKVDKKDKYRFVFIFPDPSTKWTEVRAGAEMIANDFNQGENDTTIELVFCTADGPVDESEKLDMFLESGCDGICIAMPEMAIQYPIEFDYENMVELWGKAKDESIADENALTDLSILIKNGIDAGVTIITVGNDQLLYDPDFNSPYHWGFYIEQMSRLCFVGSDNVTLGRRIAEKAIETQAGNAKIYGNGGWWMSTERIYRSQGLKEVVSENAEYGAEMVDGLSMAGHQYPFDTHGVYYSGKARGIQNGEEIFYDWDQTCFCEQLLDQDISLMEEGRIELNSYIGLWKGSNAISNVFRERGWNDADSNTDHFSILCGETSDVITAVKDHYATCAFIEDTFEWGKQAATALIDIACNGNMPKTDHIYTPFFIVDLSDVYNYFPV